MDRGSSSFCHSCKLSTVYLPKIRQGCSECAKITKIRKVKSLIHIFLGEMLTALQISQFGVLTALDSNSRVPRRDEFQLNYKGPFPIRKILRKQKNL
jgi:hypothetical protein